MMLIELSLVCVASVSMDKLSLSMKHVVLELPLVLDVIFSGELKGSLFPVKLLQVVEGSRVLAKGRPKVIEHAMPVLAVVPKLTLVSDVLSRNEKLALTFLPIGSKFTQVLITVVVSVGTVGSLFHVLVDAAFELITVGVLDDGAGGLHLIEVERAEVLSAVAEHHPSQPVKRILLQLAYVELGTDLRPYLRAIGVELVDATAVHEVSIELPLVLVAQFQAEHAPPMPLVLLKLPDVYILRRGVRH